MKRLLFFIFHFSFFVLLFTFSVSSCWHSTETDDTEDPTVMEDSLDADADSLLLYDEVEVPVTADELFDDFFFSFTTDRKFQLSRVVFPLHVDEAGVSSEVTAEQWSSEGRFHDEEFYSVIYERESDMELQKDTTVRNVRVEYFYLDEGYVLRYNFNRSTEGLWMLTDVEREPTAETPHASFIDFYTQFQSDTLFQMESIEFPLPLVAESQGEASEGGETVVSEEEWPDLREQLPLPQGVMTNIDYGQTVFSENRKFLLVEGMSNGLYVKYKFDRTGGQWHLYEIAN